jgi:hypothetical protein
MKHKKTTQEAFDDLHKAIDDFKEEWRKSEGGRVLVMIFFGFLIIWIISLFYE